MISAYILQVLHEGDRVTVRLGRVEPPAPSSSHYAKAVEERVLQRSAGVFLGRTCAAPSTAAARRPTQATVFSDRATAVVVKRARDCAPDARQPEVTDVKHNEGAAIA